MQMWQNVKKTKCRCDKIQTQKYKTNKMQKPTYYKSDKMQSEQNTTLKYKQNKIQKIPKCKHDKMFHNTNRTKYNTKITTKCKIRKCKCDKLQMWENTNVTKCK